MSAQPLARSLLRWLSALLCLVFGATGLLVAGFVLWTAQRSPPVPLHEIWFTGVVYKRVVRQHPRPIVAHVVRIDLTAPGIELLVTPSDLSDAGEVRSRTTREFAARHQVQLAINASYFYPFRNEHPLDYEPHSGDPVHVLGLTAARGESYGKPLPGQATLYMSRASQLTFEQPAGDLWNAVSGMGFLVRGGTRAKFREDAFTYVPYPRAAAGADRTGRYLILLVVDGKQPTYSGGVTLAEAAELLIEHGAWNAIQLDGGGSATLVRRRDPDGLKLVSTPANFKVPGWERSVATHLGVRAHALGAP